MLCGGQGSRMHEETDRCGLVKDLMCLGWIKKRVERQDS